MKSHDLKPPRTDVGSLRSPRSRDGRARRVGDETREWRERGGRSSPVRSQQNQKRGPPVARGGARCPRPGRWRACGAVRGGRCPARRGAPARRRRRTPRSADGAGGPGRVRRDRRSPRGAATPVARAACALCPGPGVRVNLLTLRPLDRQHTQPGKSLSRTPKRMCDRCVSARNANAASRLCAGERPIVSSEERDPFLQLYLASE